MGGSGDLGEAVRSSALSLGVGEGGAPITLTMHGETGEAYLLVTNGW